MARWSWASKAKMKWSFVVDTDSYAGNFERELGAYLVGRYDEFGGHRAGPYAAVFERDCESNPLLKDFEALSEDRMNDPGDDGKFMSPVDLAPTPGTDKYNSVAIFLSRKPTVSELQVLNERARAFERLSYEAWPLNGVKYPPKFHVIGCRIVGERTVLEETNIE